jgi:hypothetical protein
MRLLTAHKILVGAATSLGVVLLAWGAVHALQRGERQGWPALALGAAMLPLGLLYLRKLRKNPPIR